MPLRAPIGLFICMMLSYIVYHNSLKDAFAVLSSLQGCSAGWPVMTLPDNYRIVTLTKQHLFKISILDGF